MLVSKVRIEGCPRRRRPNTAVDESAHYVATEAVVVQYAGYLPFFLKKKRKVFNELPKIIVSVRLSSQRKIDF